MYWASCLFAHSPRQPAESGSLTLRSINLLSLPSDPAVGWQRPRESDSIPHEQGLVAEKQRQGLPASLGKQKNAAGGDGRVLDVTFSTFGVCVSGASMTERSRR